MLSYSSYEVICDFNIQSSILLACKDVNKIFVHILNCFLWIPAFAGMTKKVLSLNEVDNINKTIELKIEYPIRKEK